MNYTAKLSAKRVSRSAWGNFLVAVFLLLLGAFTILPIYYSIVSSLKPLNELFCIRPASLSIIRPCGTSRLSSSCRPSRPYPLSGICSTACLVAAISTAGYVLVASMAA